MAIGIKFSNDERDLVVQRLETVRNIKLIPVGNKRKFFKGNDGGYYCILGGSGDWHGIPEEVMAQENTIGSSVYLVIARWLKTRIEIYGGLLKPLFDSKEFLTRNKRGDFQFDLNMPVDGVLSIKKIPGAKFSKLDEFKPSNISIFKTLSEQQRSELLKKAGIA